MSLEFGSHDASVDRWGFLADKFASAPVASDVNDHSAVKIYERDVGTWADYDAQDDIVLFSVNADESATLCLDVFLREDGSFGFDEFRRDDGQDWTPTLPDVTDKFASEAEARAEARGAIPWFASWAYHLDRSPVAKGLKFPTEKAHSLPAPAPPVGATGLRPVPATLLTWRPGLAEEEPSSTRSWVSITRARASRAERPVRLTTLYISSNIKPAPVRHTPAARQRAAGPAPKPAAPHHRGPAP